MRERKCYPYWGNLEILKILRLFVRGGAGFQVCVHHISRNISIISFFIEKGFAI
jgi:hypothetical protein